MKKKLNIEVDISEKKYFTSKYNENTLAPELKDYLLNEIIGYDINTKININIDAKFKLTDEEKEHYKELIIKEFKESNDELEYEIELGNIKKLTLLLIGVSFVIASYFFGHIMGEILEEILMVFGWVALWEVAYAIFFTDASRRRKIKRNNQIIHANIKYKDN